MAGTRREAVVYVPRVHDEHALLLPKIETEESDDLHAHLAPAHGRPHQNYTVRAVDRPELGVWQFKSFDFGRLALGVGTLDSVQYWLCRSPGVPCRAVLGVQVGQEILLEHFETRVRCTMRVPVAI